MRAFGATGGARRTPSKKAGLRDCLRVVAANSGRNVPSRGDNLALSEAGRLSAYFSLDEVVT